MLKIPKNNIPYEMNKLLVVTGGTKGIGRAVIEKFIAHEFDIVTCARNLADLKALKKELSSSGEVHIFQADVSDRKQVKSFLDLVDALNRPVDVLLNNAGLFVPGELATEEEGVLEQMMEANLYSTYHITRGIIRGMMALKKGHIFNMCSVASIKAYPNGGSYAITKSAMLGFSRCLREELKEFGIRVTAFIPGATRTASWDGIDLPDERFMKIEDIAELVYTSYILSSRSVVEEIIIRPQLGDI